MSILTFICYGQNSQNFPGLATENPISGTEKAPECPFFGTSRSLKLTEKFSLCLTLFLNTGREADCERPLYIRCLLCGCLPDLKLIFVQYRRKNAAKYLTGNHLSDSYRHHHNRDRKCHAVCIAEHKRHDADIRDDRWKCRNKMPAAAQLPRKYCSDQRCDASADDIRDHSSAKDISDQAADRQPRNRRRCKNRKERKHL